MADNDQVDDEGRPETPARQAVEKSKQKQLAVAGVAVGLAGLIYVMFRGKGAASGGAAGGVAYSYPTVTPGGGSAMGSGTAGYPGGFGTDGNASLASLLAQMESSSQTPAEQAQSGPQLPPVINVPGIGDSYVLGPTGNPNDYKVYGGTPLWYGIAAPNGVGQGQAAAQSTLGWGYEYAPVSSVNPQQIYGGPSKIPAPGPA